jgi:hypothetical protein
LLYQEQAGSIRTLRSTSQHAVLAQDDLAEQSRPAGVSRIAANLSLPINKTKICFN